MGWAEDLIQLYDGNISQAGTICTTEDGRQYSLIPLYHSSAMADIERELEEDGTLLSARLLGKGERYTVIPVTEESITRSSNMAPHPLFDNLLYLAAGYADFIPCPKPGLHNYHRAYMAKLRKWASSPYGHPALWAIYHYLQHRTLIQDLLNAGAVELDDNGFLKKEKPFIRFRITGEGETEDTWEKTILELQAKYIGYEREKPTSKTLDYLTGTMGRPCLNCPKKIRNDGDSAKLISANDKSEFTFRGFFRDRDEALSIGMEQIQKVQYALNWIIRKQGKTFGQLSVVAFLNSAAQVIPPGWDTFPSAGRSAAHPGQVTGNCDVSVLAFEAATPGRLALIFYKRMPLAEYANKLLGWQGCCSWLFTASDGGEPYWYVGLPGIYGITSLLYGNDSSGQMALPGNLADLHVPQIAKIICRCIFYRAPVPDYLVSWAIANASKPHIYKKRYHWRNVLSLACAFLKYNLALQKPGESEVLPLDIMKGCKDRDYLYGRLLAVADRIEYRTFNNEHDSRRLTNAKRYMQRFSVQPCQTWQLIEQRIQPYLQKLKMPERLHYLKLIDSIMGEMDPADFSDNRPLKGLYLVGFHHQSYSFYDNAGTNVTDKETGED